MKLNSLFILSMALLTGHASAEQIQSTTGVNVTFRQCVEGVTACDSISETKRNSFGGLPGDREAQASQEDPAYGSSSGSAKLTGTKGNAQLSGSISVAPGARNGSTTFFLQRYTNTSKHAERLTLGATLTFDQTVPEENSVFTEDSSTRSSASAEMEIFTLSIDAIEAGTTVEDNNIFMFQEAPEADVIYESLGDAAAMGSENLTGAGSEVLSITVSIPPGESVWLFGLLQVLGANGAVMTASLETTATIEEAN